MLEYHTAEGAMLWSHSSRLALRSFSALQMDSFEYFSGDLDLNRTNTMMTNTPKPLHLTAMKTGALQPG
ncbi:MAG: hypothetical protein A3F73_03815 [Gallionellales bacterium RIFCSPLOWO2_12_FULL_59_22]|nr:MAG: hypothetical protein A3H99_04285 [Gallionellales bacterium RIFCSPLOWO2_02_FULL_59_110]OGT04867.1 MAG: hypothetical protein A2Z65_06500 [Gallionellales bacterium RIFCSPLOWO2_02_58_13]OGT10697.1 MAG: hypothetical protein A3F73_03815 [Gallionellales bacterium RIFCSPLOWO2_12_FULL_59_22]